MSRSLKIEVERFPIAGTFSISRGSKTEAAVISCTVTEAGVAGRGECVPYGRYGETLENVAEAIGEARGRIEAGIGRDDLRRAMKPGAARNAVDCALWDLEAKLSGRSAWLSVCRTAPQPLVTAMTISLSDPETMGAQARTQSHRDLLKVKVGGSGDIARMRAVVSAAPRSRIILDANEGWTVENLQENLDAAAELGIALIEQPLPAGRDDMLAAISRPVPICADESLHTTGELDSLVGRYDAVNIKLDKTGGLTAALELRERARELGFSVMVGCMVGTSLAMAPAVLLGQDADYVDLDGPLLLVRDRQPGLTYSGSLVSPPETALWG